MRGRDWEHLDVLHLGSLRGLVAVEHTVLVVFSAANPASGRDIPVAYRGEPEQQAEAMVMTPDTRPSRRTRDPETDPRPFFESPSKRSGRDVAPRSRCSILLVLLFLPPPPPPPHPRSPFRSLLFSPWSNFAADALLHRAVRVKHTHTGTSEIRGTMVSAPTVLDLRTLRSLEVNPLWGIVLTAPVDPSTRKRFLSASSRSILG